MNYTNIIVGLIICMLIYIFVVKPNIEKFNASVKKITLNKKNISDVKEDIIDDAEFEKLFDNIEQVELSNKILNETQYHNDYRDTINAFDNVAPSQKQIFNKSELPIKTIIPKISEVKQLVKSFINSVNDNVINEVSEYLSGNSGWDDAGLEQEYESKWEQQQKELGLPACLYSKPARKSKVKIVKIEKVEKFATAEQIKYVVYIVLKKRNVKDEMVVRISFVLDNNFSNEDYFKGETVSKQSKTINVSIEEIFIVGYLTENKITNNNDDFYNYNNIMKNGLTNQTEIINQLNQKLIKRKQNDKIM